jgi:predicted enzyme related to lactoylglutathione lyase
MPEMTTYAPGTPAWIDLGTTDPAGARDFYGGLFGWEFDIGPAEVGHYTFAKLNGKYVAGLGGEPAQNFPTAWTTYLATGDTDTVAKRVPELGGGVLLEPMEIPGQGRVFVGSDPTGAVFGTWEDLGMPGVGLANEPGALYWNELNTKDLAAAMSFYSGLFDYTWEPMDTGPDGPAYQTFNVGGRAVGGAQQMGPQFGDTPAHWMAYFNVEATDAAVTRAQELGGGVQVPAMDSPFGRFAVLVDPQGGIFTVSETMPQ